MNGGSLRERWRAAREAGWKKPRRYARRWATWALATRLGGKVRLDRPERLTAILLNWRRPYNVAPLVRVLLRCAFVDRVVVVNNDPETRARDLVGGRDPRLLLRDEGENRGALQRYVVARELDAPWFLALDDDLFPTAPQLARLFECLLEAPGVPHGLVGQRVDVDAPDASTAFTNGLQRMEAEVDVLNRIYGFTHAHVHRVEALQRTAAGILPPRSLASCDDVLLSFAGEGRPRIHDLGRVLDCPSSERPDVAQFRKPGFAEARLAVIRHLRERGRDA